MIGTELFMSVSKMFSADVCTHITYLVFAAIDMSLARRK